MDIFNLTLPRGPAPVFNDLEQLSAFTYEPLKSDQHIRRLQITGKHLDPHDIAPSDSSRASSSCYEIVQMDLKDLPNYKAVSYVWGDPARTHAVEVNGTAHICITKTLAAALPCLAELCSPGFLWIDQICIDQSNVQERNHQVKIMGDIYKNADEVLIWTGEDIPGLQELKNLIPLPDELSSENIKTLALFLSRPWFKRAWTVQEAVLARKATFVAGSCLIPLEDLGRVWSRVFKQYSEHLGCIVSGYEAYDVIMRLRENTSVSSSESGFDRLLNDLANTQTSDPRDHVYAFLGLQSDSHITIVPDYTLPTSQVFIAAARAIIEGTETLDFFRFLPQRPNPTNHLQLPSWVPDWSTKHSEAEILQGTHRSRPFDAARGFRHRRFDTHRSGQNELLVRGRIVDFMDFGLPHLYGSAYRSIWPGKEGLNRRSARIALQKQPLQRFFSLSDDQVVFLDKNAFTDQTQSLRKRLITVLFAGNVEAEELLRRYDSGLVTHKRGRMDGFIGLRRLWDHILVHTQQGKLALVSPGATKRDAIAILHEFEVPVILRQSTEGTYTVVGQCYLENAMYGEAVTWEEHEADSFTLV